MKVVILAGGFGTRFSEETDNKPKPMIEIGGMPILWHIMKIYSSYGFNDFVILLGYKGYAIKEYFANYFLHQSDVRINLEENNVEVLKQKSNRQLNSYDVKISQSGYLPSMGLVGSYGWNLNKSPASAFFPGTDNTSYSVGIGASLSWNLFDGGRTLTRVKNAKLTFENQDLLEQESKLSFSRDLTNSIQNFKNAKEIFNIQKKQVETATYNFDRSKAQYKLGSITAIEFRQAQINLTNAQNQRTIAKYQAKLAELQLIQITGQLLNVNL